MTNEWSGQSANEFTGMLGVFAALWQNRKGMIIVIKAGKRRTDLIIGMKRMLCRVHKGIQLSCKQQQTRN
jgi:hypothetical protein